MKNFKMVAFSVLLTLIGCDSDGQDINDDGTDLPFSSINLKGDWVKSAEFVGEPGDTLGSKTPSEDILSALDACQKDDIFRFDVGSSDQGNPYVWGIGQIACEGQTADDFIEIGTWTLDNSGKLDISYSDVSEPYVVVSLTSKRLLIRKSSGTMTPDGTVFPFTEYIRRD
ncbi:MAG: hypothetical protein ABGX00_00990 [Allomuricauda sp.]|jgi:hypothetical protein